MAAGGQEARLAAAFLILREVRLKLPPGERAALVFLLHRFPNKLLGSVPRERARASIIS